MARMGDRRGANSVSVERSQGTSPFGRPRHKWEPTCKMDHQEVEQGDMDWITLAEDRDRWRAVVNTVMNFRVP